MSTIHPHWLSTDDAAVPVRIVSGKTASTPSIGSARVSRSPAAVLGIMLAIVVGAVSYGTLDDTKKELTGALAGSETTVSAFDILARQIAEEALQDSMGNADFASTYPEAPYSATDIPMRPVTNNTFRESASAVIPTNTNTAALTANVGSVHGAAPRPFTQPESGAGLIGATLAGAFGVLFVTARNALRTQI